jgi:outer membrane protein assembly factor BamE (lipoprotein component of BamABCDE complex)
MIGRALVVALVLSMAAACTRTRITFGNPVQPGDAEAIVAGLSKADVLIRLGPPDHVELEIGGSAFEYLYSHAATRALNVSLLQSRFSYDEVRSQVDRLRVSFDSAGTVRYVGIVPSEHRESQP